MAELGSVTLQNNTSDPLIVLGQNIGPDGSISVLVEDITPGILNLIQNRSLTVIQGTLPRNIGVIVNDLDEFDKNVTIQDLIVRLDGVEQSGVVDWKESVLDRDLTVPPTPASNGDRYIVAVGGTGVWAGQDNNIAEFNSSISDWQFEIVNEGAGVYIEDEDQIVLFNGTIYVNLSVTIDHGLLSGLGDDDHSQYSLVDGTKPFTGTVGGVPPVGASDLTTQGYVASQISGLDIRTDHGTLDGLGDDDHPQYSLVDGSRAFTGTVGGIDPVAGSDLTTKDYVDTQVSGVPVVTDHGALSGLGDDDHAQYSLVDGSRAYTGTVGGIDPVAGSDLATKDYVDVSGAGAPGTIDHGSLLGLGDDDHSQYSLVDGSRAYTGTVGGIDPVASSDLATKNYVDTTSGTAVNTITVTGAREVAVPAGGTLFLKMGEVVNSQTGFTLYGVNVVLEKLSLAVEDVDNVRDFRLDVVSDPTGTPSIVGSVTLGSGSRFAVDDSVGAVVTSGLELGFRVVRTAGPAAESSFGEMIALADFRL